MLVIWKVCLEGCIILPQRLKSTLFEIFSLNNLVISQPAGIIDNDQAKIGFHFNFFGIKLWKLFFCKIFAKWFWIFWLMLFSWRGCRMRDWRPLLLFFFCKIFFTFFAKCATKIFLLYKIFANLKFTHWF